jgi:hypothetical protein
MPPKKDKKKKPKKEKVVKQKQRQKQTQIVNIHLAKNPPKSREKVRTPQVPPTTIPQTIFRMNEPSLPLAMQPIQPRLEPVKATEKDSALEAKTIATQTTLLPMSPPQFVGRSAGGARYDTPIPSSAESGSEGGKTRKPRRSKDEMRLVKAIDAFKALNEDRMSPAEIRQGIEKLTQLHSEGMMKQGGGKSV